MDPIQPEAPLNRLSNPPTNPAPAYNNPLRAIPDKIDISFKI